MPFKSKAQMKAAFGGYLGKEMKSKAAQWAKETPNPKGLPSHVKQSKKSKAQASLKRMRKKMKVRSKAPGALITKMNAKKSK